jgi:hypothetical protein
VIYVTIVNQNLKDVALQPSDLVLESQEDYVSGYHRIAQAIHGDQDLRVLVRDKTVGRWLKVMAQRYGSAYITLEELTVRGQLQQQIGVEIPKNITDQQILDSGLLDLHIPALPNATFEDYVLEVFFGRFLIVPLGLRRVGEIIASYAPEQWQAALRRPLVREAYRKRVRQLRGQLQGEGRLAEQQLLEWIDTSPELFIRNLSALRLLSAYPLALGKRVLGEIYPDLLRLKLDLRTVPIVVAGNDKAIDEIHLYLESLASRADATSFDDMLSQTSGLLEIEFDTLHRLLTSGDIPISPDLVRRVQEKFEPLRHSPRLAQALADLDLLISKEPPPEPEDDWQADQWIAWATKHYLPYRFWLESTGRLDDHIADIASGYADWLHKNYGQLIYHSKHMAWKAVFDLKDPIKTYKGPVLVVVVDNLNAKFYPEFRARMQSEGYYEHSLSYCFSMLPSCTEVSKKCLITGHYAPFPETAYQSQVEGTWSERLGKKVKYLGSIGALRAVTQRDSEAYFLNYVPLDITLHESEAHTGISHAQAIRAYLTSLAQDIRFFAHRIGAERDLMVVVLSDHGSTRIPRGAVNVIQGDFYRRRALDEHRRYISVSDEELAKLPENSKWDCYFLDRQLYELQSNYLVARRLYRFLPTDEDVYTHGGLTPEETLVPVAIYYPVVGSPKPLVVELMGSAKLYLGTKLDLTLEITNSNNHACDDVIVELSDPNIEAEKATIQSVPQLKRVTITLSARCPSTADSSAKELHLRVAYRFLGQAQENHIQLPVRIVDPAKAKFDLDNL